MPIVLERLYPEKEQVKRLYDHCNEQFRLQPIEKDLLKFINKFILYFHRINITSPTLITTYHQKIRLNHYAN